MLKKTGSKKETIVLHAGHRKDETTNVVVVPIYQPFSYQPFSYQLADILEDLEQALKKS